MNTTDISKMLEKYDVLLIGEEHDDKEGHKEKLKLFEALAEDYKGKLSLSMEMFSADKQEVLDEYLSGTIREKDFLKTSEPWNNYTEAYRPLIEHAKEKGIEVIAANAPSRYVSLVGREGWRALAKLSSAKKLLPPVYTILAFPDRNYRKRFYSLMGNIHPNKMETQFFQAQRLWDASMSHHIYNHSMETGKKIVHINGRFHSDEFGGVYFRLKRMGLKVLSLSMFPLKTKTFQQKDYVNIADILYISGQK
ncbi:MAG: ChaN family lipoprotein [Leptospiraceae bacterium]|nr:ChaN family lipoprotein [Leptospiraceae bacterium]